LISVALFALLSGMGTVGGAIAIGFFVLYFLALVLVFQVAHTVFNTALYVYANAGGAPGGFDEDVLQGAFRLRE